MRASMIDSVSEVDQTQEPYGYEQPYVLKEKVHANYTEVLQNVVDVKITASDECHITLAFIDHEKCYLFEGPHNV